MQCDNEPVLSQKLAVSDSMQLQFPSEDEESDYQKVRPEGADEGREEVIRAKEHCDIAPDCDGSNCYREDEQACNCQDVCEDGEFDAYFSRYHHTNYAG